MDRFLFQVLVSGVSRDRGSDAIRTIMLYQENHPVMKESKTHRTTNWAKNLEKKISSLQESVTKHLCPWGSLWSKENGKRVEGDL